MYITASIRCYCDIRLHYKLNLPYYFYTETTIISQDPNAIQQAVSAKLSWSYYRRLMRVENLQARQWYELEAKEQMWNEEEI